MTSSLIVSTNASTDELPRPDAGSAILHSDSVLPRPVSKDLNIADSGRISFGAGFRLPTKK